MGEVPPVQEGDVLASKYRVEKVLGQGGMGVVVAATHIELDELVALKFLLPSAISNDDLVARFLREAKASVKLKGAHVAKVHDVGRMDDGCPYIVMEHLDGCDLNAELKSRDGTIPIEEAVDWLLQACEGLAEAHSHGIIHRDLKPGNLFLTKGTDGHPLVKVLDFGISKTIGGVSVLDRSLTKTEMLLGSPLYMSPEQMRSSKNVDERADIWGLGAIAYELLTRKVPFDGTTLLDLCFKVAEETPTPINELRDEIPEELSATIMRCLAKAPDGRFSNVAELAEAIERFAPARQRGLAARARSVLDARPRRTKSQASIPVAALDDSPSGEGSGSGSKPGTSSASGSGSGARKSDPKFAVETTAVAGVPVPVKAITGPAAEPSAPEVSPASSWGTTNASVVEKSKRGRLVLIGGGVVAVGVIAFIVARSSGTPSSPATPSAATATATSAPPSVSTAEPEPVPTEATAATTTATTVAPPVPTPSVRPIAVGSIPRPARSTVAPAASSAPKTPAPAASSNSGFIRVRE